MPIRPELRHFYRGPGWRATRAAILARAGDRCESCGAPNHATVERAILGTWRSLGGRWRDRRGAVVPRFRPAHTRLVRIVLTISHSNHTPGDDREENLHALCQYCHLNHDRDSHRETRRARKDAARPLLR